MKKVQLFFAITILLLFTIGLFAGKGKFTTGAIYAYNGSKYCQLTGSASLVNLSMIGTCRATISDCTSSWSLYIWNRTSYLALYFSEC